ncbi:MAG: tripartite motif-containing protein 71, partial [Chloroflexota bacterium]|nr:tripartite motif-containing protein 71 [Chloroflexota bacterium]
MSTTQSFERQLASWMADEAAIGVPAGVIDEALSVTGRLRPRPRWLALLRETPMQTKSRVLVGSPTRRVAIALIALLAALAAVAVGAYLLNQIAAADDWTAFRGGPARTGVARTGPAGNGVIQATFKAHGNFSNGIAIVGSTAYASSADGVLHAIDTGTGSEVWSFRPETSALGSDVSVANGLAYVSDGGSLVYAVDTTTGRERWRSQPSRPASSIAIGSGMAYFGTSDSAIVALDAATGAQRWRTTIATATSPIHNVAFADGRVYGAFDNGQLVALDATTGAIDWRRDLGTGVFGTAVVANGIVYIGAGSEESTGHLRAFDAASGNPLWDVPEGYGAPAVAGGIAYATIQPLGDVAAFDARTGRQLWHVKLPTSTRAPAVAAGVVYIPADSGQGVYALTSDGLELWQVPVDGHNGCCIAVAHGLVFVATDLGTLYIIGGDGKPVAPAPIAEGTPTPTLGASPAASAPAGPPPVAVRWTTKAPVVGWAPNNIVLAPDGHLWVADPYNHQFTIFDADGKYLEAWGKFGTGDGEFNLRRANGDGYGSVAFAADGSFYVLDVGNERVQVFDKDRKFVRAWGTFGPDAGQFVDPVGIVVAPDGSICVLDDARGVIERFDKNGKVLATYNAFPNASTGENTANALAIDSKGNFYVSDIDPEQVDRFDPDGKL